MEHVPYTETVYELRQIITDATTMLARIATRQGGADTLRALHTTILATNIRLKNAFDSDNTP